MAKHWNCCVCVGLIFLSSGMIETLLRLATFKLVAPEMPLDVAVMLADPESTANAIPVWSTVAIAVFEELQVTVLVMSRLLPLSKWPIALNCFESPGATFVVDLTRVEYIDSAGLAAIFPHVDRLRLLSNPLLTPVLTVAGLDDITIEALES